MRAEALTALNFAVILLQIVILVYAMQSTIPMRDPKRYTALYVLFTAILWLLKQLLPLWGNYAAGVLMLAVQLLLVQHFTLLPRRTTLLCAVEQIAAVLLAEGIMTLFWTIRHDQPLVWLTDDLHQLVLMRIVCLFLILVLSQLAHFFALWAHKLPASSKKLPVALLPLSQGVVLLILLYIAQGKAGGLVLLALVCIVIADVVVFLAWRQLCREEQILEQLRLTERSLETQMHYYQNLREHIASVNQLRHDLNNHLQTAYNLLERGEREIARQQLDALRGQLSESSCSRYCSNPVVDAVLVEKATLCQQKGLSLAVTVNLPYELPVSGVHLCSLTSNMMDNAIIGCGSSCSAWIEFDAWIRSGCLTLRCRNTVGAQASKRTSKGRSDVLPEHGLGLEILQRIAQTYGGELQTQQVEGIFTAVVLLPLP